MQGARQAWRHQSVETTISHAGIATLKKMTDGDSGQRAILYIHTVLIHAPAMSPEPANCPICGAAAERTRAPSHGYLYHCPSCGAFLITNSALVRRKDIPSSARENVRLLRAYGHQPQIEVSRDGVRVVAGRS